MEVTPTTVKSDIKTFNQFSDDHVQQAIDQANIKAKSDGIPTDNDVYGYAVLNLARHQLNIDWFTNYNVVSANDLGESESLANPNTYDDAYLKNYYNIADNYGSGGEIDFFNGEHDKDVF